MGRLRPAPPLRTLHDSGLARAGAAPLLPLPVPATLYGCLAVQDQMVCGRLPLTPACLYQHEHAVDQLPDIGMMMLAANRMEGRTRMFGMRTPAGCATCCHVLLSSGVLDLCRLARSVL